MTITLTITAADGATSQIVLPAPTINAVSAPVLTSASFSLPTNPPETGTIGTIQATNSPTSFAIVSGDPSGYFAIGQHHTTVAGPPPPDGIYNLGVTASNAAGTSAPVTLTVTVGKTITLTPATFNPQMPLKAGQVVGKAAYSGGTPTAWAITAGDPNRFYAIDKNGVITVTANGVALITATTYSLTLQATNAFGSVSAVWKVSPFPGGGIITGGGNNGFTTFAPTAPVLQGNNPANTGTNQIYVANAGSDSTGTGTQLNPFRTIAHGSTFLRSGHDDWLLLNRGDTFTDDFILSGSLTSFSGSGMAVSPAWSLAGDHTVTGVILFGFYGSGARPVIRLSTTAMNATGGGGYFNRQGAVTNGNIAFNGWNFHAYTRDPNDPGYIAANSNVANFCFANTATPNQSNWMFEDCVFTYFAGHYSYGSVPYGTNLTNLILRRNIYRFSYWGGTSGSGPEIQGVYLTAIKGTLLIEENFFDNNGWLAGITGADQNPKNHNLYMDVTCGGGTNIIIRNNIFARDGGGAQLRPGGTIYNNLFTDSAPTMNAGVNAVLMTYNVIQRTADRPPPNNPQPLGHGYELAACQPGSTVDHNIVSNSIAALGGPGNGFGIEIHGTDTSFSAVPGTTGNFTAGSPTITNVINNSSTNEAWPNGLPLADVSGGLQIGPNTTIIGQNFNGTVGTITMSNNAVGNATGVAFGPFNLNQNITNNIIFNQGGNIQDAGTGTILTNNCQDSNGTNSGQPGEPFPAPLRGIPDYDSSVLGGPGTVVDFLNQAAGRGLLSWPLNLTANAVNNYIRAGFNFPQL